MKYKLEEVRMQTLKKTLKKKLAFSQKSKFEIHNKINALLGKPLLSIEDFIKQLPQILAEEKASNLRKKADHLMKQAHHDIDPIALRP